MITSVYSRSNGKVLGTNVSNKSKAFHAASNPRQNCTAVATKKIVGLCGKIAGIRGGQCLCPNLKCKGRNGI